jgi:hypothetical protein
MHGPNHIQNNIFTFNRQAKERSGGWPPKHLRALTASVPGAMLPPTITGGQHDHLTA